MQFFYQHDDIFDIGKFHIYLKITIILIVTIICKRLMMRP